MGGLTRNSATVNSTDDYFDQPPRYLDAEDLHRIANSLGVTQKEVVAEYVLRDTERAVELLALLEENQGFGARAFRHYLAITVVGALRAHLHSRGRLRQRQPGWKDPWCAKRVTEGQKKAYDAHLQAVQRNAESKFTQLKANVAIAREVLATPAEELLRPLPLNVAGPFMLGVSKSVRRRARMRALRARAEQRVERTVTFNFVPSPPLAPVAPPAQAPGYEDRRDRRSRLRSRSPVRRAWASPSYRKRPRSRSRSPPRKGQASPRHRRRSWSPSRSPAKRSIRYRSGSRHQDSPDRRYRYQERRRPVSRSPPRSRTITPPPRRASAVSTDSAVVVEGSPNYIALCSDEELAQVLTPPPFPEEEPGLLQPIHVGVQWEPPVVDLVSPPPMMPLEPMILLEQMHQVEVARIGDDDDPVAVIREYKVTRRMLNVILGAEDGWLFDTNIMAYMRMIETRANHPGSGLPRVFALDNMLFNSVASHGYKTFKKREPDIFSYEIILSPVNTSGRHWSLFVINNRLRTIEHLDPLRLPDTIPFKALQKYLAGEHKANHGYPCQEYRQVRRLDAPRQTNGKDCGVLVCIYAEMLTRGAQFNFSQAHMKFFRWRIAHELLSLRLMN